MSLKNQLSYDVVITTTEMHTAGEPLRIIESGFPVPKGNTIVDKMKDLKQNYDGFRKFVIWEPRGHYDMYATLLVVPDHPDADFGAIFMHNQGYSTMCGHAVMALGRYAIDRGLIKRPISYPETEVNIQCPCGLVTAYVQVDASQNNKTGSTRFHSVPSFVVATDVELELPDIGKFKVDVSFGGAFYVFVLAQDVGVEFGVTTTRDMGIIASRIKALTVKTVPLHHPTTPAFLYGVIFTDFRETKKDGPSKQLTEFADAEIDRSPCGSGSSARVALMHHRGQLKIGEEQVFVSVANGQEFTAKALKSAGQVEGKDAIITEISGTGYYSGSSTFVLEPEDIIGRGFLVH